jgi:hypothetical protein
MSCPPVQGAAARIAAITIIPGLPLGCQFGGIAIMQYYNITLYTFPEFTYRFCRSLFVQCHYGKQLIQRKTGVLPASFHSVKKLLASGALAVALLFQGYVASAHFHNNIDFLAFGSLSAAASTEAINAGIDHSTKKPVVPIDHEDDCPICQVLALGSVSILAPSIVLPIPTSSVVLVDTLREDIGPDASVIFSYLARGPPSFIFHV